MSSLPPAYTDDKSADHDLLTHRGGGHRRRRRRAVKAAVGLASMSFLASWGCMRAYDALSVETLDAQILTEGLTLCEAFNAPKATLGHRLDRANERFVPGTPPYLLKNATIWVGAADASGGVVHGDVLLRDGLIEQVGHIEKEALEGLKGVQTIDLGGKWVTPGVVDMHSHMGVGAAPGLRGNQDTNSRKAPILPGLRSLDGFNTHDLAFNNSIAGGITTMLVLPGSANNIGGQAFVFKPRQTQGNAPSDMVLEPPFENGRRVPGRWRHTKHAMGENIAGLYQSTRMDQAFDFRKAYEEGRKLLAKQDAWCIKGDKNTEPFPVDLNWEMLADVLRGNVKVNVHSYQTVDFDQLVRLSNEFKFHVEAIHHATEAYLVPELLKKMHGGPPVVAQFATHSNYKLESARGSEYAPKILADAGITSTLKSDHPVLDSRYLIWEAAQSHMFGLNWTLAMDGVFASSAKAIGMDHRIGHVRAGHDADVVVWDSMPLALGATPEQVFIDGIPQIEKPHVVAKPHLQAIPPTSSNVDALAREAVLSNGNPDLRPKKFATDIVFLNVASFYTLAHGQVKKVFESSSSLKDAGKEVLGVVIVEDGEIVCSGSCEIPTHLLKATLDLKGGSILPGLVSYGAPLGIADIASEASTQDGSTFDPALQEGLVPKLLDGQIIRGSEALSFGGKALRIAHQAGILTAVSHVTSPGLVSGVSSAFETSADNLLGPYAIVADEAAMHAFIGHGSGGGRSYGGGTVGSVSEQIRGLKNTLLDRESKTERSKYFNKVVEGRMPLVVTVSKADHIAALLVMKRAVDEITGHKIQLVLEGAHESHLLADELAADSVGVIINPPRSYPGTWDTQRILAGPPLTEHTLASFLTSKGITVGLGHATSDAVRNARFDAFWNLNSVPSVFDRVSALSLVSANLYTLLGVDGSRAGHIAVEKDAFAVGSRVVSVIENGVIKIF